MCLAVPGKIVKIKDDVATLDYEGGERIGKIIEGDYSIGDYAIVQGQIVVMKIPEDEAKQSIAMYKQSLEQA